MWNDEFWAVLKKALLVIAFILSLIFLTDKEKNNDQQRSVPTFCGSSSLIRCG